MRRGRIVSQEEIAEYIGVSRPWYAVLESDAPVRPSTTLLNRLAVALMLSPEERVTLFNLAIPELRLANASPLRNRPPTPLTGGAAAVLEAFRWLRTMTRRLWAATTEAEALSIAREQAVTEFRPDAMQTLTRLGTGIWTRDTTGGHHHARRYDANVLERWSPSDIDNLCGYALIVRPGDLITRTERDAHFPHLAARERRVLNAMDLGDLSFAMANVQSKRGFVARLLTVNYTPRAYSEKERAQLSALAEITSLALSG